MKTTAKYYFPIQIRNDAQEYEEPFRKDIYTLYLNNEVPVCFVPDINRGSRPWPLLHRRDSGEPTPYVARIISIETSPYAVTPDHLRAGQEEVIVVEWPSEKAAVTPPEQSHTVIFYVTPQEYAIYIQEFEAIRTVIYDIDKGLEELPENAWYRSYHHNFGIPYTQIQERTFVQLLLDRIIPSPRFAEYDLRVLGRQQVNGRIQPLLQFTD